MNSIEIMAKPDFVIIGAMKSATSSLQEQLDNLPGVFMTTPKEPNFFSNDDVYAKGFDWYSSLFDQASPSDIKGEASTHYTKLPKYPETITRLKEYCPESRFIYVMRHPIERLVSHFAHNWSMGFIPRDAIIDQAVREYEPFVSYSLYTKQLEPWFRQFGRDAILPVFFDRLMSTPQTEFERICSFIGYQHPVQWNTALDPSNVSSHRLRKLPFHSIIVDSSFSTWVRQNFVPQGIRDMIKKRMRLKGRPQLSSEIINELTITFNKDLSQLSELLGANLNCENFKEITSQTTLDWSRR